MPELRALMDDLRAFRVELASGELQPTNVRLGSWLADHIDALLADVARLEQAHADALATDWNGVRRKAEEQVARLEQELREAREGWDGWQAQCLAAEADLAVEALKCGECRSACSDCLCRDMVACDRSAVEPCKACRGTGEWPPGGICVSCGGTGEIA